MQVARPSRLQREPGWLKLQDRLGCRREGRYGARIVSRSALLRVIVDTYRWISSWDFANPERDCLAVGWIFPIHWHFQAPALHTWSPESSRTVSENDRLVTLDRRCQTCCTKACCNEKFGRWPNGSMQWLAPFHRSWLFSRFAFQCYISPALTGVKNRERLQQQTYG